MVATKKTLGLVFCSIFLILISISFASSGFFDWFDKITGKATQPTQLNISVANNAPLITNIQISTTNALASGVLTSVNVNFTAYDADGSANLNTFGKINFTKTGEAVRSNATCVQLNKFGTNYANYTCWVNMWYFDINGAWNIAAEINDTSNSIGLNTTHTFSVDSNTAFNTVGSVTFAEINPGEINTTSAASNNYIQLNNTGNDDINAAGIDLNATDLVGEQNANYAIYAGNFSISNSTGSSIECSGGTSVLMNSSQYTLINATLVNTNLSRGNFSLNNGVTAQEQLYPCLRLAGSEIMGQYYSTSNKGSWTVRIQ